MCGNVGRLVRAQCRETLLFKVDTSLATLEPTSSQWRLPSSDLRRRPQAKDPAGNITHTHRQTHLSLTSCEKSIYKWWHSLPGLHGCDWPGLHICCSFRFALLQAFAKQNYMWKVDATSQTIWYGTLSMGIYHGSWFVASRRMRLDSWRMNDQNDCTMLRIPVARTVYTFWMPSYLVKSQAMRSLKMPQN